MWYIYRITINISTGSDDEQSETEDGRAGAPSEPESDHGGGNSNSAMSSSHGKTRRRRTAFTSEQLLELEREFHAKKYLSLTERSQIASALKLSEVQVSQILQICQKQSCTNRSQLISTLTDINNNRNLCIPLMLSANSIQLSNIEHCAIMLFQRYFPGENLVPKPSSKMETS